MAENLSKKTQGEQKLGTLFYLDYDWIEEGDYRPIEVLNVNGLPGSYIFILFFKSSFHCRYCSMSSMQHVAHCFEMQRVRYSVTLFCRLQRVALKNTQRVA